MKKYFTPEKLNEENKEAEEIAAMLAAQLVAGSKRSPIAKNKEGKAVSNWVLNRKV